MKKVILIKYGELFLKKKNRFDFINQLVKNLKTALIEYHIDIKVNHFQIVLGYLLNQESDILKILKTIPGISSFYVAFKVGLHLGEIAVAANNYDKNYQTFKIEVKRRYKSFYNQNSIKKAIASYLMYQNPNLKVDVKIPQLTINIEVFDKLTCFVFFNKTKGVGGLPVGSNGKCLSLLSGGIDSPVASYLMQKKGMNVDYLTFITNEVSKATINKLKLLIKTITANFKTYLPKLYMIDFTKIQHELTHISNHKYKIILMRRSFYRIAEKLLKKYNYDCLVCGDSLGQVASQTIQSMYVISQAINTTTIFRPLLTYDKINIINLAKEIKTYDISIIEHEDVCALFAPKHPITTPKLNVCINLENELQLLKDLEDLAIKEDNIIKETLW